jgi:hypothetical protein
MEAHEVSSVYMENLELTRINDPTSRPKTTRRKNRVEGKLAFAWAAEIIRKLIADIRTAGFSRIGRPKT